MARLYVLPNRPQSLYSPARIHQTTNISERDMASLEFNKRAGAVLGTSLFVMGAGVIADGIFATAKPAKPGYELPAAEEHAAAKAAAAPVASEPLPVLLAKADVKKGEALAAACKACHSFDKSAKPGANAGPPLFGVVERTVASVSGYDYSEPVKAKGGKWTAEALNGWLTNAKAYVPGTKMVYVQPEADKRANLIVYLNSLSDSPAPLPK